MKKRKLRVTNAGIGVGNGEKIIKIRVASDIVFVVYEIDLNLQVDCVDDRRREVVADGIPLWGCPAVDTT
jgi:hypothetical protein